MIGKKYYSDQPIDLERFIEDLKDKTMSDVLVADVDNTVVVIFEQYYYRNDSAASCSVIINNMPDKATVVIIASGAGVGFFNFSWGATESIYDKVEDCLKNQCQLEVQLEYQSENDKNKVL